MKRGLTLATCALMACATTDTAAKKDGKKAEPQMEKMAISNVMPFDLAACGARTFESAGMTPEVLLGALLSLSPAFQECFVDAKALDGQPLDAKVKATVADAVSFQVTGTGVSATGKDCLMAAAKKLALKPLEAGAKAIDAEVPVRPSGKSVVFGVNVASDAVGTIRLAQRPALCECYAEVGNNPAPVLGAKVILTKDKPAEFVMEPNDGSTLSTCIQGKLQALDLPKADVQVPVQFLLLNSYAQGPTEGAPAALQFQQLDGIRAQRTADVLVAAGRRGVHANAYDAIVQKYKAKPASVTIAELRTKCAAVTSSDDAWTASLKSLVSVYESSLKLVQGEKGKDKAWEQVEQALTQQLDGTNKEVARVDGQKKADEGACPKTR